MFLKNRDKKIGNFSLDLVLNKKIQSLNFTEKMSSPCPWNPCNYKLLVSEKQDQVLNLYHWDLFLHFLHGTFLSLLYIHNHYDHIIFAFCSIDSFNILHYDNKKTFTLRLVSPKINAITCTNVARANWKYINFEYILYNICFPLLSLLYSQRPATVRAFSGHFIQSMGVKYFLWKKKKLCLINGKLHLAISFNLLCHHLFQSIWRKVGRVFSWNMLNENIISNFFQLNEFFLLLHNALQSKTEFGCNNSSVFILFFQTNYLLNRLPHYYLFFTILVKMCNFSYYSII